MAQNHYLKRYAWPKTYLTAAPIPDALALSIVIPAYNEATLLPTLKSLWQNPSQPFHSEIIVVLNASAKDEEAVRQQNVKVKTSAKEWVNSHRRTDLSLHFIVEEQLPTKKAGVGLARKIGMDTAYRRFLSLGKEGIIVCFDADSQCEPNYLSAIHEHFQQHPKTPGCSIHFEHPLEDKSKVETQAIASYELHLRYYVQALKAAHYPFAFHTIGSSMAVRSSVYAQQGGMNTRKAGEDFYFLHKIIPLGNFTTLTKTKVIPSPRISTRVPFGTGRAMWEMKKDGYPTFQSYAPEIFEDLRKLLEAVEKLWGGMALEELNLSSWLVNYWHSIEGPENLKSMRQQASGVQNFRDRFFQWMHGLRTLKAVHFARDHAYPTKPVEASVKEWLKQQQIKSPANAGLFDLLYLLRERDLQL